MVAKGLWDSRSKFSVRLQIHSESQGLAFYGCTAVSLFTGSRFKLDLGAALPHRGCEVIRKHERPQGYHACVRGTKEKTC